MHCHDCGVPDEGSEHPAWAEKGWEEVGAVPADQWF